MGLFDLPPARLQRAQGTLPSKTASTFRQVRSLNRSPTPLESYLRHTRQLNGTDVPRRSSNMAAGLYERRRIAHVDPQVGTLEEDVITVDIGGKTPVIVGIGLEAAVYEAVAKPVIDLARSVSDVEPLTGYLPDTPLGQTDTVLEQQSTDTPVFDPFGLISGEGETEVTNPFLAYYELLYG